MFQPHELITWAYLHEFIHTAGSGHLTLKFSTRSAYTAYTNNLRVCFLREASLSQKPHLRRHAALWITSSRQTNAPAVKHLEILGAEHFWQQWRKT